MQRFTYRFTYKGMLAFKVTYIHLLYTFKIEQLVKRRSIYTETVSNLNLKLQRCWHQNYCYEVLRPNFLGTRCVYL